MATNFKTLGLQDRRSRRRLAGFDLSLVRWVIGLGGVVALLALAALPGPAPELQTSERAPALVARETATPVMDGRGKWTGYSRMAHELRQGPPVTPGGWSTPAQLAH